MIRPSTDAQGAYWAEWALRSQRAEGKGDPYIDQVCNLVRDAASRCPAGARAVEVGCGTGFITCVLTSSFAHVWGIEIAKESLEVARQNAPGAELVFGDFLAASDLPTERDFVVSCDVVAHVGDQREFFARSRGSA
jgi:2-polyprenyl-3-methyl-5-hydroxy-6-metoxy-1,4-benzoquinol methylase